MRAKQREKNKPKFLNVTFLNTFCICSRKNGEKWWLCFNASYFTYFLYSLCRKLTKNLPMKYDLSDLIHHVSIRPFFGRLKSPGFSSLYRTPKKCPFCKKSLFIECLDFEWFIGFDFADKYQTTTHVIRISLNRRSTFPYTKG